MFVPNKGRAKMTWVNLEMGRISNTKMRDNEYAGYFGGWSDNDVMSD